MVETWMKKGSFGAFRREGRASGLFGLGGGDMGTMTVG
jgi:hypothetical protein